MNQLLFYFILTCIISGIVIKMKAFYWTISFTFPQEKCGDHFKCTEAPQTKQSASGAWATKVYTYRNLLLLLLYLFLWHQLFDCCHDNNHQKNASFSFGLAMHTNVSWAMPPKMTLLLNWFWRQFTIFWLSQCMETMYFWLLGVALGFITNKPNWCGISVGSTWNGEKMAIFFGATAKHTLNVGLPAI